MKTKLVPIFLISLLGISDAWAHSGHSLYQTGFWAGFLHPMMGPDHILAMLAIGVWAVRQQKKLFVLPLCFMGSMVLGALSSNLLVFSELEIAVTLTSALLVIGAYKNMALLLGLSATVAAGFFHGMVHGQEVPSNISFNLFVFGFMGGTALLHIIGMLGAHIFKHYKKRSWISNQV